MAAELKSTSQPEKNSASLKLTSPPENSARSKLTLPPENLASWKLTLPSRNSTSEKSTLPAPVVGLAENLALEKVPPSKTAPVKSKFRPCQDFSPTFSPRVEPRVHRDPEDLSDVR